MMKRTGFILFFLIITIMSLFAQKNVDDLRAQAKRYDAEIKRINNLIQSNNKQQATYSQNLNLINQKISNRKKIIENLDKQIEILGDQLGEEGQKVIRLGGQLSELKSEYGKLVKFAYLSKKSHSLQALLVSNAYFASYVRDVANVAKISQAIQQKAYHLDTAQRSIKAQMELLTEEQKRVVKLAGDKSSEVAKLEKDQHQLSNLTSQLKSQASELKKQETQNKSRLQSLQTQIAEVIKRESTENKIKPVSTTNQILSSEFEQNMGKLPSPVEGGVVVEGFGMNDHPTQAGIKVNNNGVNIACSTGTTVKSIFDGEVKSVFLVPSMGTCVIVRHGKFLTVYSNLGFVSVKMGDIVKLGQKVGVVESSTNILHFEIWKETEVLDPQKWAAI